MRILVIEDESGTASVLQMLLQDSMNATVDVAFDCTTARELLASETYDLLTLDYQLPDCDGLKLLEEITARKDAPPVVMVTGHGDEQTAVSAFKKGASGYVVKDMRLSTMLVEQARSALARAEVEKAKEGLEFERRQLLSIFDSIDEIVYVSDPETYEVLYANKASQDIFGEMVGRKCYEALQGRSGPCPFCTNDRIFGEHEGEACIWEFKNTLDGRWYRCIDRAIRWPDGRSVRYEMAVDINDVKVAAEGQGTGEDKFEILANTLPQLVYEYAPDGLITYVNDVAFDMFGYTREDMEKGVYVLDIIDLTDHDRVSGAIDKMMDGRSTGAIREYLAKRKDGSTFPIRAYTTLITDSEGRPAGVRGLATDITEEKEAERELKEREARFSALFETMAEGLVFIEPSGTISFANPAAETLLGLERQVIENRDFKSSDWEVLRADGTPMPMEDWAASIAINEKRKVAGKVMGIRRPDGSIVWTNISASPILDDSGELLGVVAIFTDITERRESRIALEAEKAFTEKLLNSLDDVFYVLSIELEGRLVRWNKAFSMISGYSDEELSEMTVLDFFDEEGRKVQEEFFQELLVSGSAVIEIDILLKDGRRVPYQFRSTLVMDDIGNPIYVTGVGRDISAVKEAEKQLLLANSELEGYARTVSHDLKAPLTVVSTAADFVEQAMSRGDQGPVDKDAREAIRLIAETSRKAARMTDDLLELARAGEAPAASEPVDVSSLVQTILEDKKAQIEKRGFTVQVDDDIGSASMDPTHAYQLFSNLIDNAMKYNDSETPEIRISRLPGGEPGYGRYEVCDNGPGIPEGMEEEIFLPFHKGAGSTGSGVGLSIVSKVVRLYGGRISARSDGGACFEFTLPVSL
jgi:PAS domain S-box-containing protein